MVSIEQELAEFRPVGPSAALRVRVLEAVGRELSEWRRFLCTLEWAAVALLIVMGGTRGFEIQTERNVFVRDTVALEENISEALDDTLEFEVQRYLVSRAKYTASRFRRPVGPAGARYGG